MSQRRLTVVVTCTDRKARVPEPLLRARTLPDGSVGSRLVDWGSRVRASTDVMPILDLYRGESWVQVRRLLRVVSAGGFMPDVFVASAGLGLRRGNEQFPAYSATFGSRHADSVAETLEGARAWWNGLPRHELPAGQPALLVLPETYSRVTAPTWEWERLGSSLVFGGSSDVPDPLRVPADRSLRAALGGTTTSINTRAAAQWMTIANELGFATEATMRAWDSWRSTRRVVEVYNRTPMSDEQVRKFVRSLVLAEPAVSQTRALRELRDAGLACEQRRFSEIFREVTK